MARFKNAWIEEEMDSGLGDHGDQNLSLFIENIRQKGREYEQQKFWAYMQEIRSHHHPSLVYVGLGHFYRYGIGIPQDYIQAMLCYIKASALGYKPILIHVARRFRLGEGTKVNYTRAINCCFSCMDGECDIRLCYFVTLEIIHIYSRINHTRFSLADNDEPGFMTVDESRVEAVLDRLGSQLGCSFDHPIKYKRRTNKEIFKLNQVKLYQVIKALDVYRESL